MKAYTEIRISLDTKKLGERVLDAAHKLMAHQGGVKPIALISETLYTTVLHALLHDMGANTWKVKHRTNKDEFQYMGITFKPITGLPLNDRFYITSDVCELLPHQVQTVMLADICKVFTIEEFKPQ